jgi:hypothetical protein
VLNLSCPQIKKFVDGHNWRRQQLVKGSIQGQPAASEMKYMVFFPFINIYDQFIKYYFFHISEPNIKYFNLMFIDMG